MSQDAGVPEHDAEGEGAGPRDLEPSLGRLVAAAGGPVGLNVLLLFGQDPMTCDTAQGLAMRLHHPVADVREALASLSDNGVLRASERPGKAAHVSYWLSEDSTLFSALRDLIAAYTAGPSERRLLLRAISSSSMVAS